MADLATREATGQDFDFIWKTYSDYARPLVSPHMKRPWADEQEQKNFLTIWKQEGTHIILVNEEQVGWFRCDIGEAITLEHLYLTEPNRGRGIGGIIIKFITEEAKKQNKNVLFSTFKENPGLQVEHHKEMSVLSEDAMLVHINIATDQ
jgi:GNAT superfamily N-acetyltransferase